MTDEQPEALRLANIIENKYMGFWQLPEAATELRRLHEENQTLKRCLFQMQEAAKGQGLTAAKAQGDNNAAD